MVRQITKFIDLGYFLYVYFYTILFLLMVYLKVLLNVRM